MKSGLQAQSETDDKWKACSNTVRLSKNLLLETFLSVTGGTCQISAAHGYTLHRLLDVCRELGGTAHHFRRIRKKVHFSADFVQSKLRTTVALPAQSSRKFDSFILRSRLGGKMPAFTRKIHVRRCCYTFVRQLSNLFMYPTKFSHFIKILARFIIQILKTVWETLFFQN